MKVWGLAFVFVLLARVVCAEVMFEQVSRCAGGDGPHPLQDITSQITGSSKILPTVGNVAEFAADTARDTIYYRTQSGELEALKLSSSKNVALGKSKLPLSTTLDPYGRFLLARDFPWLFQMADHRWYQFGMGGDTFRPLFWSRDSLYTISPRTPTATHIRRLFLGADYAQSWCYADRMRPAKGHSYPYAFFYNTKETSRGPRLKVYELDVRRCQIVKEIEFTDPLTGPVEDVYRFKSIQAIAVKIRHPESNLLWQSDESGCHYHNLEGKKVMPLGYDHPLLGAYSPNEGLQVLYPNIEKVARVLDGKNIISLDETDVALDAKGTRIFVNPLIDGNARPLISVPLNSADDRR